MKIHDITATIGETLPSYGDKRPNISKICTIASGAPYNFSKFHSTTHTGTHADMPSHFIDGGAACDNIALSKFCGRARVIRIETDTHITREDLLPYEIPKGIILLLNTGQSKYMSQPELKKDFVALTPDAAEYLVECDVKTVGIDYLSVDPYDSEDYPVHKILLGRGIPVLEGLVLDDVPEGDYILSAFPLKIEDGDGSPVRALLVEL